MSFWTKKMELLGNVSSMRIWRTLQAICADQQICSWSTWYPEIPSQLLNMNTAKFQMEHEPVLYYSRHIQGLQSPLTTTLPPPPRHPPDPYCTTSLRSEDFRMTSSKPGFNLFTIALTCHYQT